MFSGAFSIVEEGQGKKPSYSECQAGRIWTRKIWRRNCESTSTLPSFLIFFYPGLYLLFTCIAMNLTDSERLQMCEGGKLNIEFLANWNYESVIIDVVSTYLIFFLASSWLTCVWDVLACSSVDMQFCLPPSLFPFHSWKDWKLINRLLWCCCID